MKNNFGFSKTLLISILLFVGHSSFAYINCSSCDSKTKTWAATSAGASSCSCGTEKCTQSAGLPATDCGLMNKGNEYSATTSAQYHYGSCTCE
jgi:hypothetical protein